MFSHLSKDLQNNLKKNRKIFGYKLLKSHSKLTPHVQNTNQCYFITSAKEVMFLPDFVCLSVCLSVNRITQKVTVGSF